MTDAVSSWLSAHSRKGVLWYVKRLSANDTLATNAHQAGPYLAKETAFAIHAGLNRPKDVNPDIRFALTIDSHNQRREVRLVWYNNRISGSGTRNETRLTNFGGADSPFLDPESTGAIAILAFESGKRNAAPECHAWVCRNAAEEEFVESLIGPVEPGLPILWDAGSGAPRLQTRPGRNDCSMTRRMMPEAWLKRFPSGEEIIRKAVEFQPLTGLPPDERLVRRRDCEYQIFRSIEREHFLPRIRQKFNSIDAFVGVAQAILQSRKSRSGNSLELHAREIFREEGFVEGRDFSHRPIIEGGKRPDFIFPSAASYEDGSFPQSRLTVLAAKTTCKDRWRQILNEADRSPVKHLLTLQEGLSETQYREMKQAGVRLVVPESGIGKFPAAFRGELVTLDGFLRLVKARAAG